MPTMQIQIGVIRTNGETQPRACLNDGVLKEYEELWRSGVKLPPVEVVYDGEHYWLWDGFHRLASARKAGQKFIDAKVQQGDLALAQWLSCGANKAHGLRRTTEEKQAQVAHALQHPFSADKTDRVIGEHCGVSHPTVARIRQDLEATGKIFQLQTRTGKDGKTRDVANIQAANHARAKADSQPPIESPLHGDAHLDVQSETMGEAQTGYLLNDDGLEEETVTMDETDVPEQVKDKLGRVVPEQYAAAFQLLPPVISQIRQHLIAARKVWKEFTDTLETDVRLARIRGSEGYTGIDKKMQPLELAVYSIGKNTPYTLCVFCKLREEPCSSCHGSGWITEESYAHAPKDIQPEGSETYHEFQVRRGIAAA